MNRYVKIGLQAALFVAVVLVLAKITGGISYSFSAGKLGAGRKGCRNSNDPNYPRRNRAKWPASGMSGQLVASPGTDVVAVPFNAF